MQIYLDHSATTPPRPEAIAAMQTVLTESWGNPSSLHTWGERSAIVLETARAQVASFINAPHPNTIAFTSGGTEADNLALFGIARRYSTPQHLIISKVEHSAIAQTAQILERLGWEVTRLGVDRSGRVNPADLAAAIRPNTVAVSIIYGQSEVGTLQPIAELGSIARDRAIPFHTDAVQAAGRLPIDVGQLPVDLLSLSSHKIYGPQGAGALYIRPGIELLPLLGGGGQEREWRSGTQAVPAIAGFGMAAELAAREIPTEMPRLSVVRDRLFHCLADCAYLEPTGSLEQRLPHHVSFRVKSPGESITGRTMVRQLSLAGIASSPGSACHSGQTSPSPILLAMGYNQREATTGFRLSLGRSTALADVEWTAMTIEQILDRLIEPAPVVC